MSKRKICVVTGTRADYGLLYWTMKGLQQEPFVELQVVVTGMHLSPEFGSTGEQIKKDGFLVNKEVECLLSSDTEVGITKSMGLGMIGFADAIKELKPDLMLVLGDRFEIFSAVSAAMIAKIPVAHCHGGEATEGAFDESIRHSITKMSHIHFTSTEEYKKRVIQLGEHPNNVYNVGALGIENINKLTLLSRDDFEKSINFKLNKKNVLVTFHPVTLDTLSAESQCQALIEALDELTDTNIIFTMPNADTNGRVIIRKIEDYVKVNTHKSIAFTSLGQLRYLSAMNYIDCVVGNSSSGLIEVPSFKIATINIGDRQSGRVVGDSVINCEPNKNDLSVALEKGLSRVFKESIQSSKNPYGEENASVRIIEIVTKYSLDGILKKQFYNL